MLPVYDPRCLSPGWLGLTLAKPENCSGDRMETDEQRGVKRQTGCGDERHFSEGFMD